MTKTDIVHVPYRATTGAMADLLGDPKITSKFLRLE
jgi:hypothetical protein